MHFDFLFVTQGFGMFYTCAQFELMFKMLRNFFIKGVMMENKLHLPKREPLGNGEDILSLTKILFFPILIVVK